MQAEARTQAAPSRKILVVEDNLDQVRSLVALIRDLGHSVDYAINGYVAIDLARRFRPDVVILDIGLPGLNGFEVLREIRKDPDLRGIRAIAFTAYNREDYRELAQRVGFDEYIVKPQSSEGWAAVLGDASRSQ